MAISYPFNDALNLTPEPNRMVLRYVPFANVTRSPFSGSVQATRNAAVGIWGLSIAFPPMEIANAAKWIPLFNSLYGSFGSMIIPMYNREAIRGTGAGTPVIDGASQTGTSILIRGMTPSATGVFLGMDLINIGTGLYEIVRDVDADGSGEATMEIWPGLRTSPADGASILTSSVTGVFRQAVDFVFDVDINSAAHYGFGWEGEEAI